MALSTDLWSHIYSFTRNPASAALVSKQHRQAAYQALYIQLHELSADCFLRKIGEDLGKWRGTDPDRSIQRWLMARERAITSIQVRQPRLTNKEWRDVKIDPFNSFHWQLQDIRRAGDAIQKNREDRFVTFFEEEIQAAGFQPPLNLPEYLSNQEKAATIRNWLETNGTNVIFNRWEASNFDFPPCELALKLPPDILRSVFSHACYEGDYEFLQATLTTPPCLETLAVRGDLIHSFLHLCEKYPVIGKEILNNHNPSLIAHLAPARSMILDVAIREGYFSSLNSFENIELHRGAILEKACYAGQSEIVKKLLKNHHFSSAELGWSLFVTVEGPAVLIYLLPIPFIYSLFSHPLSCILAHGVTICCPLVIYRRFFPPEPRPAALNGEIILSPTEKSVGRPLIAFMYLLQIGICFMPAVLIALPAFQDDQLSMSSKTLQTVSGLSLSIIAGTAVTVLNIVIAQHELPKRSFSVLGGFYSAIRDTAVGRLKVMRDLGSAILQKIPCLRSRVTRNTSPVFKKA